MKKTLIGKIVLIATLFLIYFGFQKEQVQAAAPIARGIDVSMWQKNIDWNAVASEGISFAFIRFGNTQKGIDPYFTTNLDGANQVGIRTGVYIFSYATTPEAAAAEAYLVLANIGERSVTFPIVIDLEGEALTGLTKDQLAAVANTFCNVIENAGYYPLVYASKNWFTNKIGNIGYDKWVAQYADACTYENPMVWQATSKGAVSGIAGNVDIDYLYKDYFSWIIPEGFVQRDGKTFLYKNYRIQFGLVEYQDYLYLFDQTGAMQTGFVSNEVGTYYFQPDGKRVRGFNTIDNNVYYFNDEGMMQIGFVTIEDEVYLFNEKGIMVTGWITDDTKGTKYYFLPDGKMAHGWQTVENVNYYFNEDGTAHVGNLTVDKKTYHFDVEGKMYVGWAKLGESWFYFQADGSMIIKNSIILDGITYVFDKTGAMTSPVGAIPVIQ